MFFSRRKLMLSYAVKLCITSSSDANMFTASAFVESVPMPSSRLSNTSAQYATIMRSKSDKTINEKDSIIENTQLYRKPKQKRRKPKNQKRPSAFWADINNIEKELRLFWSSVNVSISASEPPPIPNEALLNHYERHDLRYAIAKKGRKEVSEKLGGARLIPGKWSDAIRQSEEVKCLLSPDNPAGFGLSKAVPPIALHKKRTLIKGQVSKVKKHMHDAIMNSFLMGGESDEGSAAGPDVMLTKDFADILISESIMKGEDGILDFAEVNEDAIRNLRFAGERWAQQENRKPRGYWDHDVIITELYDHLAYMKKLKGRPSIWMPRSSEISDEGRNDLRQAITRFGGTDQICGMAKLVPYKEWLYFESQLELFIELQAYLPKYKSRGAKKSEKEESTGTGKLFFPRLSDIRNNGHDRLHDLVMDFGGRKMIAIRLDMEYQAQTKVEIFRGMSFGKFDLEFAIKLLLFMRKEMMECDPSLDGEKQEGREGSVNAGASHIQMPTVKTLLEHGETQLAEDVKKYGGHESIARRLHLRFDLEETRMDAETTRAASRIKK